MPAIPSAKGYISSLARPGGSTTGLSWDPSPEILGKPLDLVPAIEFSHAYDQAHKKDLRELTEKLQRLQVVIQRNERRG
jgi:hypothetical protein